MILYLSGIDYSIPAIYVGIFESDDGDFDTFLKMDKFTKVVFLRQA